MNKRLKIVSSLALAGMLVTSSLGMNKVLAATAEDNYTTNPVAVYRNLVEGKTVVPFVLVNRDDVLTVKDVVESDMFNGKVETINGTTISSLDTLVGTGDKFTTTDGTEYTIVVYGDVDGDGRINALDALQVEKSNVNMLTLDDVQREAADVKNDARVNSLDSLAIKRYVVGLSESVIDTLPEKEEVVEDSNYVLSLKDASYVNSTNVGGATLAINLKETLDEATDLKLVVSDGENKVEQNVTVSAHTDYMEIALSSLAGLKDGTLTVNLYDGETIVGTVQVVKNTVVPDATNVNANRTSTRNATLSLEKCGTSHITKVKYVVKGINDATPALTELTNSVDVQNGKLTDAQIADNLQTDTAYKVFYVVENQYGSQSAIKEAIIASDAANVEAEKALKEVVAPDLTKTSEAKFTWSETGNTYVATLYKDGSAISEKTVTASEVDFSAEMKANGTYKVSVVVKGADDGSSTNSPAKESAEVTVSTLKAVEGLKFENRENGKVVLSWTNPNGKDDFKAYDIDLYTVDAEGKETKVQDVTCNKVNANNELVSEVEVSLNTNTIYVAKVKLEANDNQTAVLGTDYVVSEQFYKVAAPNMDTATKGSTSVTFTINPINIANKEVTYKVEVYDVKVNNDATEARYTLNSTRDVTVSKDNKITVDGLTSLNTYAFKLVATVDGNEVESEYSDEIRTLPTIENLTVDTAVEAGKANSGKIAVDGNNLVINGEAFDTTEITELATAKTVLDHLEVGDVVTINDNATNVTVNLAGAASTTTVAERDFGDLSNATVAIENNKYNKIIKGTFKTLTLNGNGAIYTVNDVTSENPIVVADGVEVVGNQDYKVQAGANVIINDVKVSATQETAISASGKTLTVTANESANDLVFENASDEAATIVFDGLDNNTSEQKGTITIKSNGGKVTVKSEKVNVSANMNVEVNNGTVDITAPSLTGDKTVTVSADEGKQSSVIAQTETSAPDAVKAKGTVELKEYTDDQIKEVFGVTDQDEIIAISEYIDSFGLNGKGATITFTTTDEGQEAVIITVNGNVADVDISNIK